MDGSFKQLRPIELATLLIHILLHLKHVYMKAKHKHMGNKSHLVTASQPRAAITSLGFYCHVRVEWTKPKLYENRFKCYGNLASVEILSEYLKN